MEVTEKQKLETALLRAVKLMVENGLGDWKIDVNSKRTALAETYFYKKTIVFSKHFVTVATEEQFVGVTYHEIAHAILGRGHGHDNEFKKLCMKISPNADYARRSVNIPIRKYLLECPSCGNTGSTNVNKDRYCGVCWRDQKQLVVFERRDNLLKPKMW